MLTPAERQAAYRKRHPEKIKARRLARRPLERIKDAEYRARVGTHPMNIAGTDAYIRYRKTEGYRLAYIRNHLKRKYGISLEQFNDLLKSQNGKCKICGGLDSRKWKDGRSQRLPLCVDHDHKTKKVRGLLCNHCNVGIALLKENVEILQNAIQYLKEN